MKAAVIASAIALAVGIAAGRFSAPTRVENRVEYKDRVVFRDRDIEKKVEGPVRVHVVTRTIPGPRGPERIVERFVERGPVVTQKSHEGQASVETQMRSEKVVVNDQARLLIGPTVGARLGNLTPVYGGFAMWRFGGPFWLGASADQSGSVKLQFAISF